jgi:hypothetical protein
MEKTEVEYRGWNHPDIYDVAPGFGEPANENIAESRRAFTRIPSDTGAFDSVCAVEGSDSPAQTIDGFVCEVSIDDSADVILAKDLWIQILLLVEGFYSMTFEMA